SELPVPRPRLVRNSASSSSISFAVTHLLQPEARRRGVQHPQKFKMLVLRGVLGKLDHRSGLLEHLPTTIQHEVVVRSHESKSYIEGMGIRAPSDLMPLIPRTTFFKISLLIKSRTISDYGPSGPHPLQITTCFLQRKQNAIYTIGKEAFDPTRQKPVSNFVP